MAKKNNIFNTESYEALKLELHNLSLYISNVDIKNLEDDVEWKLPFPKTISTIEKKLKTLLTTIDQCSKILIALYKKEGMSKDIKLISAAVIIKLRELQNFFREQDPNNLTHRRIKNTIPSKKGMVTIDHLTCTKEDQIIERGRMMEMILKILPNIEDLESLQEQFVVRGTGEGLPSAMLYD